MQTLTGQTRIIDNSSSSLRSSLLPAQFPTNQSKKSKIGEFISWSVCFAIIAGLTGMMKWMKVAVTMESITSGLFYLSIAGLIYFIYRIISLSGSNVQNNFRIRHELN